MKTSANNTGFIAYSVTLAFLFASILNLQDVKEMAFWALGFCIAAFLDEWRGGNLGFGCGWVFTIAGNFVAFWLLGPAWSPLGFAVGYILGAWTVVEYLQPSPSRDLQENISANS